MSEIDINKMVEKAKRRKQWSVSKSENAPPAVLDGEFWLVACDVQRGNAEFIAQAPATILALHQQTQDLQAENAALRAQLERVRAHVPDWELRYWGDLPDESPTAESEE